MSPPRASVLDSTFRWIIAKRWLIVAFYALIMGPSVWYALKVDQDNSIDRLIVQTDPAAVGEREFEKVFGAGEYVVLLAEANDPYQPDVLKTVDELEKKLAAIPKVEPNSALAVYRRAKAGFTA